jgi:CRISPR-associated endonuclease Csy4
MKNYLEITLLPNEELPINFLWSKVFQQIHLGLVEIQDDKRQVPIGVSFPEYFANEQDKSLCSRLRLFAPNKATLVRFDVAKCLARLSDYVHCTSILEIPADKITGYAFFKRVRPNSNNERLARRRVKRKGVSFEQALAHYEDRAEGTTLLPYIQVQSQSSGQSYRLFIEKVATSSASSQALFSTYGLSSQCAVPLF